MPILAAIIFLLPYLNHITSVILLLVFSTGCTLELIKFYSSQNIVVNKLFCIISVVVIIISSFIGSFIDLSIQLILISSTILVLIIFSSFSFIKTEHMSQTLNKSMAYVLTIFYVGILSAFIALILASSKGNIASLTCFIIIVIGNDATAWLGGKTIGKGKGIFAVSPQKSISGFLTGLVISIALPFGIWAIFPNQMIFSFWKFVLLGLSISIAGNFGDLFESALKRAAKQKDSGAALPGRGGFLDTFDSFLFAAPIFYINLKYLNIFTNE